MRRLLPAALAGALLLTGGHLRAQECGDAGGCAIEGGVYHARMPDGVAKGAVVFLHGWGGTSEGTIGNDGLMQPLLARGYAVIAPQGMPRRPGESGGRWNASASPDWRDDVDFVRRAVADAADRFAFPREQVIASGFSGGGMMVWRIACDAPGDFAAYAPISGLMWRPLPETCKGPVRLHHVHGWSDTVVPLEGRSVGGGRITQGDLFVGLDLMREAAGCVGDDPDGFGRMGETLVRVWQDCAPGGDLVFALHPGGHSVPPGWADMALDWFEGVADDGSG